MLVFEDWKRENQHLFLILLNYRRECLQTAHFGKVPGVEYFRKHLSQSPIGGGVEVQIAHRSPAFPLILFKFVLLGIM